VKRIMVNLSDEVASQVEAEAKAEHRSLSNFIEYILIKNIKPAPSVPVIVPSPPCLPKPIPIIKVIPPPPPIVEEEVEEKHSRMYKGIVTWSPFVGCKYDCVYCRQSYQNLLKWQRCSKCKAFEPHDHPDRLTWKKIFDKVKTETGSRDGSSTILWPCATGDITFADPKYMRKIIEFFKEKEAEFKGFYWQSKDPKCLAQYLKYLPKNSYLLTTLETNRDEGYRKISQAPLPSQRIKDFLSLDWPHKILTLEPLYEFDLDVMYNTLQQIKPECIWIGYNSRNPDFLGLVEPENEKVGELIKFATSLKIEVIWKHNRDAWRG
jgi:hypothetical protein